MAGVPAPVVARRKNREKLAWGCSRRRAARRRGARRRLRAPRAEAARRSCGSRSCRRPRSRRSTCRASRPTGASSPSTRPTLEGKARIWVRPLNALDGAAACRAPRAASRPFWSPDSRFLGFIADGELKKIDVTGGPPTKICDAPGGSDGTWSPEGVILFDGTGTDPIYRVPAAGGTPAVAVKLDAARKETSVGWPEFLPDGKHFLYLRDGREARGQRLLDRLDRLERDEDARAGADARRRTRRPGYLLFVRDRTLVAQPFDAKALQDDGRAGSARREDRHRQRRARALLGLAQRRARLPHRRDRAAACSGATGPGRSSTRSAIRATTRNPTLSPDGRPARLRPDRSRAAARPTSGSATSRAASTRASPSAPATTSGPSGRRTATTIVFTLRPRRGHRPLREGRRGARARRSSCSTATSPSSPSSWSPRRQVHRVREPEREDASWDLWALPTFGDAQADPDRRQRPSSRSSPVFSPDGRFVAYVSNESGREEIYVQTFPDAGRQVAGLQRRRRRSELARRRQGALLPLARPEAHGGRDPRAAPTSRPASRRRSFPSAIRPGTAAQQVRAVARTASASSSPRRSAATPMTPTTVVLNWPAGLGK